MAMVEVFIGILLAFYLYLLVRKQHVREPGLYRLGLLGFVLVFMGGCFGVGNLRRTQLVFEWIGFLWALFGAVAACRGIRGPYDSEYRPDGWGTPKKDDAAEDDSEEA